MGKTAATYRLHDAAPAQELLSIVVPVYNEEAAIAPFLAAIDALKADLPPLEIVFVNDGSSDATEVVIAAAASRDPRIRLINLSRNFGKEAALCAGLDHANGTACVPMDVDLQDPPALLPQMVRHWRSGARIVNARRILRSSDTWLKRTTARGFYRVFNAVAERPIPAVVGDFRLLDREVVEVLKPLGERARFNKALFAWVGFETAEVEYDRPGRAAGTSAWSYWKLCNHALDGIFHASTVPLRVWSIAGFLIAMAGFAYAAFIFFLTIVMGAATPGFASTIILISIFGGLNLLAIGILGEYIGRIYHEVRERPLYIIRRQANGGEG